MIRTTVTRKTSKDVTKTISGKKCNDDENNNNTLIQNLPTRGDTNPLSMFHKTVRQAKAVNTAKNGMKFVGKIKLIPVEDSSDEEIDVTDNKK